MFAAHAFACAVFLPQIKEVSMEKSNYLGTEKVGKLLRQFAIPCICSLIISCLYNIVDQIFVGNGVGYLGNAATGVFPNHGSRLGIESVLWRWSRRRIECFPGTRGNGKHSQKRWQRNFGFFSLRCGSDCRCVLVGGWPASTDRRNRRQSPDGT